MDEGVGAIEGFLAHSLPDMAAAFTAPVAIVVLLFVFDWRFGLAAVACVVAAFGVEAAGFSNKSITGKMRRHLVNQERMTNATVEYVRGMPVVKAFGQTAESFGRLSAAVRAYTDLALDVALFWQSLMPAFTAIINSAYLFVLPVGIALGAGLSGADFRPFALDFIFYLLFVPSIAGALNKMMYIEFSGSRSADASIAWPVPLAPDAQEVEDLHERRASLRERVLDARRDLGVLPARDEPVGLELLEAPRERAVGYPAEVAAHLVEADGLVLHEAVED